MQPSTTISQIEFEHYLEKRKTVEHVLSYQEFIDGPEFLVILTITGESPWAIYGFYCLELEDLEDAILFRATELLKCPCVDEDLKKCRARVMHRGGQEWIFGYCPDELGFRMQECQAIQESTTESPE